MSFDSYCYTQNCHGNCSLPACMEQCCRPACPPPVDDWRWRSMIIACERRDREAWKTATKCTNSIVAELSRVSGCTEKCLMKRLLHNDICNCVPKKSAIPFTDVSEICDCFQQPVIWPFVPDKKKKSAKPGKPAKAPAIPSKTEVNAKECCPCACKCAPTTIRVKKRLGPMVYYVDVQSPQFTVDPYALLYGESAAKKVERFKLCRQTCS